MITGSQANTSSRSPFHSRALLSTNALKTGMELGTKAGLGGSPAVAACVQSRAGTLSCPSVGDKIGLGEERMVLAGTRKKSKFTAFSIK